MAAATGRGLRPGGVARALGRLTLLVGFGFVSGLVIGVLSEEPELLAGHLRGESESIVLTSTIEENPSIEEMAPVAEAPAEADGELARVERAAVMKPRPDDASARPLPEVAAPRSATSGQRSWTIQVGAFSEEAAARRLADGLRAKGYPAALLPASDDAQRWRVRVQPIEGEERAEAMSKRLKRDERLPTWVLPMEGRSAR
jgi:cell division septation protein DedD